jgi:hypothetical protein
MRFTHLDQRPFKRLLLFLSAGDQTGRRHTRLGLSQTGCLLAHPPSSPEDFGSVVGGTGVPPTRRATSCVSAATTATAATAPTAATLPASSSGFDTRQMARAFRRPHIMPLSLLLKPNISYSDAYSWDEWVFKTLIHLPFYVSTMGENQAPARHFFTKGRAQKNHRWGDSLLQEVC